MRIDDLYGYGGNDVESVRTPIEQVLGIVLLPSRNAYRGDHYTCDSANGETFVLQHNWSPLDTELMEEMFPEAQILLYVTDTSRPNELEVLLTMASIGLVLLRREQTRTQ